MVLLVSVVFFYQKFILHEEFSEFDLTPKTVDAAGITPDTTFILKSSADLSAAVIQKYLKFEPEIDYDIKKVEGNGTVFEIIPESTLNEDEIYSVNIEEGPIAVRTYSWAYQVKATFQIISSLPRDKANEVPMDTGIEIAFNRENLVDPEDFFEIYPSAQGTFEVHRNVLIFIPSQPLEPKTIYTVKIKSGLKVQGSKDILEKDTEVRFETGRDYDTDRYHSYFNFGKTFWEFKPDTEVAFAVEYFDLQNNTIPLTIYRFENAQEFLSTYKNAINEEDGWTRYHAYTPVTPASDKKVLESNVPIEEQTRVNFIRVPQKLSEGYYLADVTVDGVREQTWFQVTPIAGFSTVSGSKTLLWLKDLAAGENIPNAEISFGENAISKTNDDGVAVFDTPGELLLDDTDDNYNYYFSPLPYFYIASVENRQLVIPVESEYGHFSKVRPPESWWSYFSLDKGIYLPTDNVHFWGIVKQRNGTDIKGEEVTIQLTDPFWYKTPEDTVTVYGETKSQISDFYTLTGDISFSNLRPGLYQLNVMRGDEVIVSENVNVETYIKPAYRLTLTADKSAIFAGDTVTYKAKAEFFDGTPVANMRLNYNGYLYDRISGEVQLNKNGEGTFTVKTQYNQDEYRHWQTNYLGMDVSPAVSEEGEINASVSVLVFGSHVDLRSEQTITNKVGKFDLTVRNIVLDKPQTESQWWNSENYLGDPVPNWSVSADVEEIIYHRREIDRGYDFINKTTYPIYEYDTEYRQLKRDTLTTDVAGNVQYTWVPEEGKSYRITFITKDAFGRLTRREHYMYGGSFSYFGFYDSRDVSLVDLAKKDQYKLGEQVQLQMQDSGGNAIAPGAKSFIFMRVNNGAISYQASDSSEYSDTFKDTYIPNVNVVGVWFSGARFINSYPVNLSFDSGERELNIDVKKDKERYRPGDTVDLDITVTDKDGKPREAEVNVSGIDEAVFSLNPDERDTVNTLYQDIYSYLLIRSSHYSPLLEGGGGAEKGCFVAGTDVLVPDGTKDIEKLHIGEEVLTWKEGSTKELVKAKIKRVSSHVVSGYLVINDALQITVNHRLLVNGVWKHAGEIKVGDVLLTDDGSEEKVSSIKFIPEWTLVYNIELDRYHTYFANGIYVHNEEKGGGGAREDFRDLAIYKNILTNSDGQAKVSFDVPDDITSWRLTTQAITKDLFAGKAVDFVPVGLPFFVEATLNRTYLTGDTLELRVRTFGTADVRENIQYTVESETLPFKKIEKKGSNVMEIPLGNLTPGKHHIKISANAGNHNDAIIREVDVLDSYFSKSTSEFYELSPEVTNIQGSTKGYTKLLFTSYERGRFYNVLRWLTYQNGVRVDQMTTQWFAKMYLNRFFDEKNDTGDVDMTSYQVSGGGITLLPYSDEELELSAKFANLIKDEAVTLDVESLKLYFKNSLNDRKADLNRAVKALYGLSAFREPILVTIQNIKSDRNLSLEDKIYIALALDNLGAKEEARSYYSSEIRPALTVKTPYVYVDSLEEHDDNILATALLAGLTASLNEPESDGLGQYALSNYPKKTLKNFEILLYLKALLPRLSGDSVSFSWSTIGKDGTETLEENETFHLDLSKEELASLKFTDISGRVGLVSSFEKESTPAEIKKDQTISVSRSYSVNGVPTTKFSDGDLVRIDIVPTFAQVALEGAYQVVDYLPSGLRPVTNLQRMPTQRDTYYYHLYPSSIEDQKVTFVIWKDFPRPFFYYARVVSKGEYKAEPVLIQSLESFESANISKEASVSVQ